MSIVRFPSLVDIHVHLRDPGATQKEDFYTGTSAALAGGITTVFDMPNNPIPTFSEEALNDKLKIANEKAVCNWGLYFGTDGKNVDLFEKIASKVVGLKVYLNSTTGKYIVEDERLVECIFAAWPREKVIVVHAEKEKLDLALKLCAKFKNKLHIAHVSTKEELEKIIEAKKDQLPVTCEVTPHHLFLTDADLKVLKNYGDTKPSLVSSEDQEFLWSHLGDIDCIASDHAPHLKEEKESDSPPSGVPGLETMLPLLLNAMNKKQITKNDIIRMLHTNPHRIFNITPDPDTYTEVDPDEEWTIRGKNLKTKCGWTPFEGWKVKGKVVRVRCGHQQVI